MESSQAISRAYLVLISVPSDNVSIITGSLSILCCLRLDVALLRCTRRVNFESLRSTAVIIDSTLFSNSRNTDSVRTVRLWVPSAVQSQCVKRWKLYRGDLVSVVNCSTFSTFLWPQHDRNSNSCCNIKRLGSFIQRICPGLRLFKSFRNKFIFTVKGCSPTPNPQAGGPPLVVCLQLLIQYIRSWPP
jgi:hypothetical protein